MPTTWTRADVIVCGTRLSLLEREAGGTETGAPILLLHGLVAEAETFRKLSDLLPTGRRVIALDLPGSGFSERPKASDASFGGVAAMVRETISKLRLKRPILLGHSYGGAVALKLAVSSPEWLRGLILLCPAHPFSQHGDKLVRFYLSPPGQLFAHLLPMLPRPLHLFALRRMPGSRAHFGYRELEPYLHTLRGPGTIAYLLRLLRSWKPDMAQLAVELEQHSITLPTLVLLGDRDIVVPPSTAKHLLRHLPSAECHVLHDIGHLPNEEAPEECADLIAAWVVRSNKETITEEA